VSERQWNGIKKKDWNLGGELKDVVLFVDQVLGGMAAGRGGKAKVNCKNLRGTFRKAKDRELLREGRV